MTPRPSERAREALRAARERAGRGPARADAPEHSGHDDITPAPPAQPAPRRTARDGATEPPSTDTSGEHGEAGPRPVTTGRPGRAGTSGAAPGRPGDGERRPGDVAREALRRAVLTRRAGEAVSGAPETAEGADGAGSPGGGSDEDAADALAVPAAPGDDTALLPGGAGSPGGGSDEDAADALAVPAAPGDDTAPPSRDDVTTAEDDAGRGAGRSAAEGDVRRPSQRPGDIAREALRSARAQARRERTRPGDGAPEAEERKSRASAPAPRVPRTARGDRATGLRARELREFAAEAFRMPAPDDAPERDVTPDSADRPTSPDPGGTRPTAQAEREAAPDSAGGPEPSVPGGAPPSAEPKRQPGVAPGRRTESSASRTPPPVAATPRTPRSMAAPTRDGDLRRTFPRFPPQDPDRDRSSETWWGNAWITALEEGALDAKRLARGRGYAAQGHVDAITVTPGLVLAYVQGSRPRPYRVQVRLRTFGDADWERFLEAAAERPGHIAALLDKEMPPSLADCGAPLLPGPGDLAPQCSCPDSGHPCKHAAALCYQTARLLDADPFVLLLLRGRGEREVVDDLSRRSAARSARAAQEREPAPLPGVRASDALAARGALPPLPAPLTPPAHPEQPPVYPAAPGGPDAFALDQLATDAAARAHTLLTTGRDPVGALTLWQDAVRLAAARPGSGLTAATRALYSSLASAAGRTPAELARAVAAWRQGGPAGLAVLEEPWDPPAGRFDRARPQLLAADLPAFRPWRNRLTHPRGHLQLRLGRDHLWYAYESEPGREDWWPRGTPDPDPVGALTGLDSPERPEET
ncbi:SWIM zinc finger family protein [Streptomyces sp. NPDC005931]|uniref:SWIM zinc finger family protein n=1 Tax=Streptomyces sp. NPDC005931 TaxID=3364737 RepID=UPI0036CC2D9C